LPGIGHRWHEHDLRAERLIDLTAERTDGRHAAAVRALAERVARHVGHPVAVNIDGALAVALTSLRLDPEYGDFLFAIARSFGLAAHIVEERARERPMRLIDPTAALYDGVPVPGPDTHEETNR
jgi:citrate synthase